MIDLKYPESTYLLEYKVYQTPIEYDSELNRVRAAAGDPTLTRDVIGQWEGFPYDNYMALHGMGVRVALAYWVPHHARRVLCEFIENVKVVRRGTPQTKSARASGTSYVNIDLRTMRSLAEFLCAEHAVDHSAIDPLIGSMVRRLEHELPVVPYTRDE